MIDAEFCKRLQQKIKIARFKLQYRIKNMVFLHVRNDFHIVLGEGPPPKANKTNLEHMAQPVLKLRYDTFIYQLQILTFH